MIDHLLIGTFRVPVTPNPDLSECGEYNSDGCGGPRIELGSSAGAEGSMQMNATIFHEALHCISELYELNLSEAKVRVLEQTVLSLLQRNPEFAASLTASFQEGYHG